MDKASEPEKNIILYVDDDEFNLMLFLEFMKKDYVVLTAESAAEGYELLKKHPVKVLISDQRMPDETGLDFIERINPEFPDLIKIIFTAHVDHDAALKAINQGGIYRYVLKPWNFNEMQQTLQNAIREYDLRAENKNLINEILSKNTILEKAYLQIKENEKKFTGIFQASSDGMMLLRDARIIEVNEAFIKICGFDLNNYSRENLKVFIENRIPFAFQRIDELRATNSFSMEFVDYKQTRKFLEVKVEIFELSGLELVLVVIRNVTDRKMMEQKIMEAIFRTQEEAQGKYAQELHDGLGPVLSTVKMYIEWLCNDKNTLNRDLIKTNALHAVDEAINQAKEIANNLSPHILQRFGLVNALKNYGDRLMDNHPVKVAIRCKINERLSPDIEIMLYRILLECINNSVKYASPENITIDIDKTVQKILVSYTDNGKGFDVDKTLIETKGMGIFNMQNRLKLIGGEINIRSSLGKGTTIDIILTK
ncbi:MAG TPA: response regulator [Bacteroidales bacterium]|nr:response regulator [Bacteroidales bacterium]